MEALNVSHTMNGSISPERIDDLVYYVSNLLTNKNWSKSDYGKWQTWLLKTLANTLLARWSRMLWVSPVRNLLPLEGCLEVAKGVILTDLLLYIGRIDKILKTSRVFLPAHGLQTRKKTLHITQSNESCESLIAWYLKTQFNFRIAGRLMCVHNRDQFSEQR